MQTKFHLQIVFKYKVKNIQSTMFDYVLFSAKKCAPNIYWPKKNNNSEKNSIDDSHWISYTLKSPSLASKSKRFAQTVTYEIAS